MHCIAHRVIKSPTWLSDFHFHILFLLLDLMYWLELLVQVCLQLRVKNCFPPPSLTWKAFNLLSLNKYDVSCRVFFCRSPLSGGENSFLFLIYQKYLSLMGTELFKQILGYTYWDFFPLLLCQYSESYWFSFFKLKSYSWYKLHLIMLYCPFNTFMWLKNV